jgi:hypothetical protein
VGVLAVPFLTLLAVGATQVNGYDWPDEAVVPVTRRRTLRAVVALDGTGVGDVVVLSQPPWRASRACISSSTAVGKVCSKSMSFAHVGVMTMRTIPSV